jgi:uncharacterized protein
MDTADKDTTFPCNRKPEITYPCAWVYKVIGKDPDAIKDAIQAACSTTPVQISPSHSSSQGTYWSFSAELIVDDEQMRLAIHSSLAHNPAVKFVL